MRKTHLISLLICAAMLPATGSAQSDTPRLAFGITGSMNLATMAGSDVTDASNRVAYAGGVFMRVSFNSNWALQPELLYVGKGVKLTDYTVSPAVEATVEMSYVELPILLRATATPTANIHPYIELGGALAAKSDCKVTGKSAGVSVSMSCADIGGEVQTFDAGAVGGLGLEFPMDTHAFSIGVRYTYGLIDPGSEADAKHRNLQFMAGFRF